MIIELTNYSGKFNETVIKFGHFSWITVNIFLTFSSLIIAQLFGFFNKIKEEGFLLPERSA